MKKEVDNLDDKLRPKYNFSPLEGGVRSEYVKRYQKGQI